MTKPRIFAPPPVPSARAPAAHAPPPVAQMKPMPGTAHRPHVPPVPLHRQLPASPPRVQMRPAWTPLPNASPRRAGTVQLAAALDEPAISESDQRTAARFGLRLVHENKDFAFYEKAAGSDGDEGAEVTQYWYRAITEEELGMLDAARTLPMYDSYGGIASNRSYVKKYFNNKSASQYIVEFMTPSPGWLHQYLRDNHKINPKPESGASSFGLGETGTNTVGAVHGVKPGTKIDLGGQFNLWLMDRTVRWTIVNARFDKRK